MQALHDDSIILILSYLDLNTQLSLLEVHSRFYRLMPFVWCLQYKSLNLSLQEISFSNFNLNYFFKSISQSVKKLRLRLINKQHLEALTSFIYPQVHDFRFSVSHPSKIGESDMPRILKAFPNVKTFSPQGKFTGEHFASFAKLENLTTTYCSGQFKVEYLINILEKHQLKTLKLTRFVPSCVARLSLPKESLKNLEYIELDVDELPWFINNFGYLPKLREFYLSGLHSVDTTTLDHLSTKLCEIDRRNLKILETCNSSVTFEAVLNHNLHVDILKIVADNHLLDDYTYIGGTNLQYIKEIYFKSCFVSEETELTRFLSNSQKLEVLCFEDCEFSFTDYEFPVEEMVHERYLKLKLILQQNNWICAYPKKKLPWAWTLTGESSLLEVSEDHKMDYTFEPIYMAFDT